MSKTNVIWDKIRFPLNVNDYAVLLYGNVIFRRQSYTITIKHTGCGMLTFTDEPNLKNATALNIAF